MSRRWSELREEFARVAFEHGIINAARMIPMSRSSAYRVINGEISRPSQAIRANIERIVESERSSQVGQSPSSED